MALAPQRGDTQIVLSVFGGRCTQMAPTNLPEGASPDNQDVEFAPGKVYMRRGFQKIFSSSFAGTVVYAKSYVTPDGAIENLYLDSAGSLSWEDVTNAPGVLIPIGTVSAVPGVRAKSTTAFGREYIAVSDGLRGCEVPLQWDGTNLDRVTQDGPGAPPTVASVPLASSTMAAEPAVPLVLNINEADPGTYPLPDGSYAGIYFWTNDDISTLAVGTQLTLAGFIGASSPMNGTWTVLGTWPANGFTLGNLVRLQASLPSTTVYSTGPATATVTASGATLRRANNIVTVHTTTPHNLQPGYQVKISGVAAAQIGGGVSSITIRNEDSPGVATVTTNDPHGLVPGTYVQISGVTGVAVGGGILNAARAGGIITVVTNSAHGLSPGAIVTTSGCGDAALDTTASVMSVPSPTSFTFLEPASSTDIGAINGGIVTLNWPVPDAGTPHYYEVLSAPTSTTFEIQLYYSDGTWTTGTITYEWDGTYFVSAVPDSTTLTYQQYGPDATGTDVGTVTPYGQASPGKHQCQVLFVTRQGAITRPSPPVEFEANGGQFLSVSGIPIGPPNVVARILAFTGSGGAYFFYIPTTPQVGGQAVGSATQINDNTTDSVLLDFSDNTLFAATGVSIPGNNLAAQVVLDSALGFGFYGSRLITWGQRNTVQSLLGMSFDSGHTLENPTIPCGWTPSDSAGQLATGHFGQGWQITTVDGTPQGILAQPAYHDAYGAEILHPNTRYRFRCWARADATASVVAVISGGSAFSAIASVNPSTDGGWLEASFDADTPGAIPPDLKLSIYALGEGAVVLIDECSLIYDAKPYLDNVLYGSYVDNPEGFDGLSGKFGPSQDIHKVLDLGTIRNTLYLLTQDPGGRLHQTTDNGVTEPAGWTVQQVGANCGLLSAWAMCKSQADDSSASGGEEWLAWASASGARIFGGDQPWKISEENQPDWDAINPAALDGVWAFNDPVGRVIYFGVPTGDASGANLIYPLNYQKLDSAYAIATAGPVHVGYSGRMSSTDHTRKWTLWNAMMNGASLMYRQAGKLQPVFWGGNGSRPGSATGQKNVYILNACYTSDDDYALIRPYYVTFFFTQADTEMSTMLGAFRHMLAYTNSQVKGYGYVTITPLVDAMYNPWAVTVKRPLKPQPTFSTEWSGANATGERIALKFEWSPN